MKKLFNLLLAFCLPTALQAQPTINNMENYTTPYKVKRVNCTQNTGPGNAGTNLHWMFDNLTETDTTTEWILPTSITPRSAYFPNATEVRVQVHGNDSTFAFYRQEPTMTILLGSTDNSGSFQIVYENPGIFLAKRPMLYQEMLMQGYDIFRIRTGPITGRGQGSSQADAWGMLHLPNGMHNNVLRIKTIIHSEDTITTTPTLIVNITDGVRYTWYSDNFKSPLMTWDSLVVDIAGNKTTAKQLSYLLKEGDPASVNQVKTVAYQTSAYFAGNMLHLKNNMPQNKTYDLTVLNAAGQKVYSNSFTPGNLNSFATGQELAAGLYIISIAEKGGQHAATLKVMKQ